jgi:hypothetical protein
MAWSLAYLLLGAAWLAGAGGNPADPAVDQGAELLTLLGAAGPRAGAALLTGLAGLGVLLAAWLLLSRHRPSRAGGLGALPAALAVGLGLVLAVVLPDYRLLAAVAYTPILLVLKLFHAAPEGATAWPWPVVNLAILGVGGLAWLAVGVQHHRQRRGLCVGCGRGPAAAGWASSASAARWGRWATGVAVAVPLGYAVTRYAWALGVPLGVSRALLDELGDAVYAGAGLATLAVGGAVLTLGLVQRWGEVFPRWLPWLRGRPVPVGLAVVPAFAVALAVASAGLMFVRFAVTGGIAESFPGEDSDVAAWLPELFWPLWAVALAGAAYAYWLRRRGPCTALGA